LSSIPGIDDVTMVIIEVDGPSTYWGVAPKKGWEWMSRYWGESG